MRRFANRPTSTENHVHTWMIVCTQKTISVEPSTLVNCFYVFSSRFSVSISHRRSRIQRQQTALNHTLASFAWRSDTCNDTRANTHTGRIAWNRYIDSYNMHSSFDSDWPSNTHFGFFIDYVNHFDDGKTEYLRGRYAIVWINGKLSPEVENKLNWRDWLFITKYNVIRTVCRHYQRLSFMNQLLSHVRV